MRLKRNTRPQILLKGNGIYSLRLGAVFDLEFPGIPCKKASVESHILFVI